MLLRISYYPLLKKQSCRTYMDFYLLCISQEVEKIFTPEPILSFGSATTINSDNSKILSFRKNGSFQKMC